MCCLSLSLSVSLLSLLSRHITAVLAVTGLGWQCGVKETVFIILVLAGAGDLTGLAGSSMVSPYVWLDLRQVRVRQPSDSLCLTDAVRPAALPTLNSPLVRGYSSALTPLQLPGRRPIFFLQKLIRLLLLLLPQLDMSPSQSVSYKSSDTIAAG